MGYPLLYLSDSYADDLPYWVADDDNTGILILPYTLDQNDMKFCVPPGFGGPESFFNYLKNAFDAVDFARKLDLADRYLNNKGFNLYFI